MKREDYEEAKRKNADWDKEASQDIKTWVKLFVFDSILAKREYTKIMAQITKRIESFVSLIDEKEIADAYRSELTEYAEGVYKWTDERFGKFTANMLATYLTPKDKLTKAQIQMVEKDAQTIVLTISGGENEIPMLPKHGGGAGYTQGTAAYGYFEEVHKATKKALDELLELNPKKYKPNINLRNIAEMTVRFEAYKKKKQELIDAGVRFVLVRSHANCSKRCEPYQGRVYSLDGTSGTFDGRNFVPLEDVADNVTYTSKNTGKTYQAGLFAYNCRHDLVEYKAGMNIEKIPKSVIEERRNVEARQREMERDYRTLREQSERFYILYRQSKNEEMRKIAREAAVKAATLRKQYEAFSERNEIAMIPSRLRIMAGENRYVRTVGKKDSFVKEVKKMKDEA